MSNLSRNEADHLVCQPVWPWQTDKLVPVPRHHLRHVKSGQKCNRDDSRKSETKPDTVNTWISGEAGNPADGAR